MTDSRTSLFGRVALLTLVLGFAPFLAAQNSLEELKKGG